MTENWKDDNCAAIKSHYAIYSVPKAAALWCGVEKDQIDEILSGITKLSESGFGRGVCLHDDVPCLEPRSRVIADAILSGALAHGRHQALDQACGDAEQLPVLDNQYLGNLLKLG